MYLHIPFTRLYFHSTLLYHKVYTAILAILPMLHMLCSTVKLKKYM